MTGEFKQWVDELAKGLNFPQNAVVMCTAIDNEETHKYNLTAHFDGGYYAVSCIMEFLVKQYLKSLDDEYADSAGDVLIDIIHEDKQRRNKSIDNWISVNDRLPEEDKRVIVCCRTKKGVQNINLAYQCNGFWHGSGSMSSVTHWQPLPEPPKERELI